MLKALRRGRAAIACLLATVGLMVTGLVVLPVSRGIALTSASAGPTRLTVSPTVGGPTSIMSVHFVADYTATVYGGDFLSVVGPDDTRCAGDLIGDGGVNGPNADGSGPVTLYIGPRIEEAYPWLTNTYDPASLTTTPLTRWCPGSYTGQIGDSGAPGTLEHTFQFSISATKHTTPPTVARHLRPVALLPGQGGLATVFAVRYRADRGRSDHGDVVQVDGPKHSACSGTVVRAGAGREDQRVGSLTLHIGPGASRNKQWYRQASAYVPVSDNGLGKPLRQWCSGTYQGTVFYEDVLKFTVVARFKLRVRR
jgi:hypothetical protein